MINTIVYALLASRLRQRLRSLRSIKRINRLGGSVTFLAGLIAAAVRPASG